MKTTSDGIPAADWAKVRDLAVAYANSVSSGQVNKVRAIKRKILLYLNKMEEKYGALPSILATKSDYLVSRVSRERLLLRAFASAHRRRDLRNQTLIASSLAELYVDEAKDAIKGRTWLRILKQALFAYPDKSERKLHRELTNKIEELSRK